MKTSVIEVHDMLSVLSVLGVEERIGKVPGVESVTVNFAAGSATVRYDETRLEIADIKAGVRQIGYESSDETPHEKPSESKTPHQHPEESPAKAAPSGSAAAAAEDRLSAADGERPYDGEPLPERRQFAHRQSMTRELLIDNLASRSRTVLMAPAARGDLLRRARDLAPADPFELPWVCDTWRARMSSPPEPASRNP